MENLRDAPKTRVHEGSFLWVVRWAFGIWFFKLFNMYGIPIPKVSSVPTPTQTRRSLA